MLATQIKELKPAKINGLLKTVLYLEKRSRRLVLSHALSEVEEEVEGLHTCGLHGFFCSSHKMKRADALGKAHPLQIQIARANELDE